LSIFLFKMAGLTRLELATFRVTGGRSNQLSYSPINGSLDRTRTCDLTINSRVLYQLSYQGINIFNYIRKIIFLQIVLILFFNYIRRINITIISKKTYSSNHQPKITKFGRENNSLAVYFKLIKEMANDDQRCFKFNENCKRLLKLSTRII
jgi:hypothetical protein